MRAVDSTVKWHCGIGARAKEGMEDALRLRALAVLHAPDAVQRITRALNGAEKALAPGRARPLRGDAALAASLLRPNQSIT